MYYKSKVFAHESGKIDDESNDKNKEKNDENK